MSLDYLACESSEQIDTWIFHSSQIPLAMLAVTRPIFIYKLYGRDQQSSDPISPPPHCRIRYTRKMCGIFCIHGLHDPATSRSRAIALSKRVRHRGPDWSGCFVGKDSVLVHERLAIVGVGQYYFSPVPAMPTPHEAVPPRHI
jgi:hypothetical protein